MMKKVAKFVGADGMGQEAGSGFLLKKEGARIFHMEDALTLRVDGHILHLEERGRERGWIDPFSREFLVLPGVAVSFGEYEDDWDTGIRITTPAGWVISWGYDRDRATVTAKMAAENFNAALHLDLEGVE